MSCEKEKLIILWFKTSQSGHKGLNFSILQWAEYDHSCHSSADKKKLAKTFPDHLQSFPCLVSLHFNSTPRARIVGPIYLLLCIWGWGGFLYIVIPRITIPAVLLSVRQPLVDLLQWLEIHLLESGHVNISKPLVSFKESEKAIILPENETSLT